MELNNVLIIASFLKFIIYSNWKLFGGFPRVSYLKFLICWICKLIL